MTEPTSATDLPNGAAAAAILAVGIGALALGVFALAGDASPSINHALSFYVPTGALSGVTTLATLIWLAAWLVLGLRWGRREVPMARVNAAAFTLLAAGLLLTFPPAMDFLQGK